MIIRPGRLMKGGASIPSWVTLDPETGALPSLFLDHTIGLGYHLGQVVPISSLLTVVRASGGYGAKLDGSLQWFGNNTLRQTDAGLLVEGARTNLLLRSQEFENASWSKNNATITANAATAPDGTVTADLIAGSTGSGGYAQQQVTQTSGVTDVASLYVKAGSVSWVRLSIFSNSAHAATWFNLSGAGSVGTNAVGNTATIAALANGWYRISISRTTGGANPYWSFFPCASDAANCAVGNSAYIWGAQLEAAAFPSSYIPTGASTATRAADNVSVSLAGLPGWTAGQSLTLVTELYSHPDNPNSGEGGQCWLAALGPANSDGFGVFLTAAETRCGVSNTGDSRYTGYWKKSVARRISGTSNHIFCNGVKGSNGTNLGFAGDVLSIGQRGSNIRHLNGTIKRLTLFGRAISDAGCQGLSL